MIKLYIYNKSIDVNLKALASFNKLCYNKEWYNDDLYINSLWFISKLLSAKRSVV